MKPLPTEDCQDQKAPTKKSSKPQTVKRSDIIALLEKRLSLKEISRDEKIVDKTCYKLIRYIQNGKNFSLEEIKGLLSGLELSSITIQKRKKHLVEKKSRKRV